MSLCFHYQVQSVLRSTKWLLQILCKMIDFMKWFHVSTAKSFCQLLIFDTGRIKKCLHRFATWNHITVKNWTVMLWVLRLNTEHSTTPFQVCQITKNFGSPSTLKHLLYYCARNYCTRLQFFDYKININYLISFII